MASHRLLSDAFLDGHPTEAAAALETMPIEEIAAFLADTRPAVAARVLERMLAVNAGQCIGAMATAQAARVIETIDLYAAAAILRTMDASSREPLLAGMREEDAGPLRLLLSYPEGTAGALMDPRVKVMPSDVTVREAIARMRKSPGRILYYVYVVERDGQLVGVLNMRELMLAPSGQTIGAVARRAVARLAPEATRATIVAHPRWRDVHALPVADGDGRLLGAIRYGTFRRLETEAALERRRRHPATLMITFIQLYWLAFAQLMPAIADALARVLSAADSGRGRAA